MQSATSLLLLCPAARKRRPCVTGCLLVIALLYAACLSPALAQQREIQEEQQIWVGYMTTTRVSDRFSLWNDFHHIPSAFVVARTGLTYHFPRQIDVTAGYAHLWLPLAGKIKRREHRPWGQIVMGTPLGGNFNLQQRLRWEMRYRQQVSGDEIVEGYTFNHRGRIQAVLRKSFPQLAYRGVTPSLVLADELLMDLGKEVTSSHFNQNRISLMAGLRYKGLLFQAGYMNRYVQTPTPGRYTSNHTLVVWLFQNLDLRKKEPMPLE